MGVLGTERSPKHPSVAGTATATPLCSTVCGAPVATGSDLTMRYTEIDQRIGPLASRQFGVFSRQQAFDLGAIERFVKRRLQDKDWLRPVPAVYALLQSAGTWKRQCKIAELSIDDAAIAG